MKYGSVYLIYNMKNSKAYIGVTKKTFNQRYSAIGTGVERVVNYYLSNKKVGSYVNKHLVRSIQHYGFGAFIVVEEFDGGSSKDELLEKEVKWIRFFQSNNPKFGYNRTLGGDDYSLLRGSEHPNYNSITFNCDTCGKESTKNQYRYNKSKYHYCSHKCRHKGNSTFFTGTNNKNWKRKTVPCDFCEKPITKSKSLVNDTNYCSHDCQNEHYKVRFSGEKNPNFGNGHKIVGAKNGRARKVKCVTTDEVFETLLDGANKYNIRNNYISACCTGRQKSAGKLADGTPLQWEYIE